jgi:hypothetical protein
MSFGVFEGRCVRPPRGYSFRFANSQAINLGDVLDFDHGDAFTWSIWVKNLDDVGSLSFSKMSGSFLGITLELATPASFTGIPLSPTEQCAVWIERSGDKQIAHADCRPIVGVDEWINIVVTKASGSTAANFSFFRNAVQKTTGVLVDDSPASLIGSEPWYIGRPGYSDLANRATARFAHAAMWTSELTATHVGEVYNNGAPPDLNNLATAPAPDKWLKLDNTDSLTTITDHGSDGNDATGSNFVPGDILPDGPFEIGT